MKKWLCFLSLCVILIINCSVDQPTSPVYDDQHRPEVYDRTLVSLGNSLTAGMQNSGMREDWQRVSFPALIAEDLGIEKFNQQLFASPGLGTQKTPEGIPTTPLRIENGAITYDLRMDLVTASPQQVPYILCPQTIALPELYHNLAVPGATTKDIIEATSSANSQSLGNSFFDLVLRNSIFPNLSPLQQAVLYDPSYITLWAGNNDVLGGIISGTVVEGVTVTPVAAYQSMMETIFDSLLNKTDAKIFVANIPPVTATPYVTTIPTVVDSAVFAMFSPLLPLTDAEKAAIAVLLSNGRSISLGTDEENVACINLSALSFLQENFAGVVSGTAKIPGTMTLTATEVATAQSLVQGYNQYLASKASSNDRVYLIDIYTVMENLSPMNKMFYLLAPAHSYFSLDGVHPNSQGYELIAEEFLKVMRPVYTK